MCLKSNRTICLTLFAFIFKSSSSEPINCTGKNLTVQVADFPPFLIIRNDTSIEGLSYHIFSEALKGHNVTFKIMPGPWTFNGSFINILNEPSAVSAVMYDLVLIQDHLHLVQHTMPISIHCFTFLVPKLSPLEGVDFLWLPIENTKFWIYIWPYIVFKCVWCLWPSAKSRKNKIFLKYFNTWRSLEMVLLLFISTYYCGFISTLLTHPMVPKGLETVDDLIDNNVRWEDRSGGLRFSLESYGGKYDKLLNLAFNQSVSEIQRKKLISKNQYALVVYKIADSKFCSSIGVKFDEEFLDEMHIIPKVPCLRRLETAFLLNKQTHPCLVRTLNRNILRLQAAGLISYWVHNVVRRTEFRVLGKLFVSYELTYEDTIFTLSKLQSAFYMLLAGYALGFIAFLYEVFLK